MNFNISFAKYEINTWNSDWNRIEFIVYLEEN